MKLEVGMYVRTKWGDIRKIERIWNDTDFNVDKTYYNYNIEEDTLGCVLNEDIIKEPSFNIIDLIKSKDIILGTDGKLYQCWKIYKDYVFTYSKNKQGQTITLVDYQIDKVLTKEQFEQSAYKVGDK